MKRLFFSFLCCLFFFPSLGYGEGADSSPDEKLAQIRERVEEYSQQLEQIRNEHNALKSEVQKRTRSIEDLKKREDGYTDVMQRYESEIVELQKALQAIQEKVAAREQLSRKRIRALYMHRSDSIFDSVVQENTNREMLATTFFMSKVRSLDKGLVRQHRLLMQQKSEKKKEIDETYAQQRAAYQKLLDIRKKKEIDRREKQGALTLLERKEKKTEELMVSLQSEALRLETVLHSLTEGATLVGVETQTKSAQGQRSESIEGYIGDGLRADRKDLLLPVLGKVLRDYGKRRHEQFTDLVHQKGIEFEITDRPQVRAIQRGKVLFTGQMPALGTIVIIDHGNRTYSLYGKLADPEVRVGDAVEQGAAFARVQEVQGKKLFYFEIRNGGKAVDPQKYYREQFLVGKMPG